MNLRIVLSFLLIFFLWAMPDFAYSQQNMQKVEKPNPLQYFEPDSRIPPITKSTIQDTEKPIGTDSLLNDAQIKAALKEWHLAYYKYRKDALAENQHAFAFQNVMSYVVFFLANLLLLFAVWAAFGEFVHASRMRKTTPRRGKEESTPEAEEINISLQGIALKTSFHGTLLLVIAFAFYYLFLKFVYPINVIGQ